MNERAGYADAPLAAGIRSRMVNGVNGLDLHLLEAGFETPGRPCILLLHGFPELAYSWRRLMLPLAQAGYHVLAPDQRGYGRTTGWDPAYDGDLASFRVLNLVRDMIALLSALGLRSVAGVVGHDFGASVAAWAALARPDLFRSMVLMSAPFAGAPAFRFHGEAGARAPSIAQIDAELARLDPPRRHYQGYYSTREADADMHCCPQGVHAFLRAYFHHKSADWRKNVPQALESWAAEELAKMPAYYIMRRDRGMAATVADEMPSAAQIAACRWLPDEELAVYSAEYARNGFQGGLQWYRCRTGGEFTADLLTFSGRTIDVPSCFIAGRSDWGIHQRPGDLETMQRSACSRMQGCHLVAGAGHWVQQEQPEEVGRLLLDFLRASAGA